MSDRPKCRATRELPGSQLHADSLQPTKLSGNEVHEPYYLSVLPQQQQAATVSRLGVDMGLASGRAYATSFYAIEGCVVLHSFPDQPALPVQHMHMHMICTCIMLVEPYAWSEVAGFHNRQVSYQMHWSGAWQMATLWTSP
jgi:hypothetical protein